MLDLGGEFFVSLSIEIINILTGNKSNLIVFYLEKSCFIPEWFQSTRLLTCVA